MDQIQANLPVQKITISLKNYDTFKKRPVIQSVLYQV